MSTVQKARDTKGQTMKGRGKNQKPGYKACVTTPTRQAARVLAANVSAPTYGLVCDIQQVVFRNATNSQVWCYMPLISALGS